MSEPLYPVPRSGLDQTLRSGLIGGTLPNPAASAIFWLKPLRGVQQEIAAVVASALIAFTAPAPALAEVPKILSGALQAVEEVASAKLLNPAPLIEQGLGNLLFRRPLAGIVQLDVDVPPRLISVPFASPTETQKLLFQHPLGVAQTIEEVGPPRITQPEPITEQGLANLLFRRPLAGVDQDVVIPLPSALRTPEPITEQGLANLLFQRSLAGVFQEVIVPPPSAVRTPEPITEQGLANLLFTRPLAGVFQEVIIPPPSTVRTPEPITEKGLANLLFRRPIAGIEQVFEAIPDSQIITPPEVAVSPPVDVLFQRPLVGVVRPEVVVPAPTIALPVASPTETQKLLFQRSLWGIERPDEEIRQRLSLVVTTQLTAPAAINVLFQYPLAGRDQPIHLERAPLQIKFPQPPPPAGVSLLFQRPLAGRVVELIEVRPSDLIAVPIPDIAPPAPDLLFLHPLTGREQLDAAREARSLLLVGSLGLPSTPIPVNVLFQRPFIGLLQEVVDPGRPRILRVQVPDPPAVVPPIFFLRPLGSGLQPVGVEYASTLLFGLDPERDVLFLRPLSGRVQDVPLVGLPKITRVTPDIAPPPISVLFQKPRVGLVQEIAGVDLPRIIRVPVVDVAPASINVLFQRPLAGPLEPVEVFRRPDILRVLAGTIPLDVLFQRPMVALVQLDVDVEPSDIIRVRAADPPPDPALVLFQWALAGVLQPSEDPGPGKIIRRSYAETPQLVSGVLIIIYSDGSVATVINGVIVPLSAFTMILND